MQLFKHQKEGFRLAMAGNRAFFWECGTGKSCMGLTLIRWHKLKGRGPALVVCPLSIIESAWIEDCKKFTPDISIVSLWSCKPSERRSRLNEKYDIYVANYETFKSLYEQIVIKGFEVIIVDESSKMKDPRSQITKALMSLAGFGPLYKTRKNPYCRKEPIRWRYVLSGTPAPNDESEYHQQIKFISGTGNKCFDDNFYSFRGRYFRKIPLGLTGQNRYEFYKHMRDEFMDAMKPVAHVVRKVDALDLPQQFHEIRKVYLSPREQNAYEILKTELLLEYAGQTVLARTALTELMKLRQLTSGFAYTDTGIIATGQSKLKELKALLEEIGNHQVIIWGNFKFEIKQLLKELPLSRGLWSETADRDKTIADFKAEKFQYLIANPQSAGHGLTFVNCRYAAYFSLNYSYELFKQSQDRIHRYGQRYNTTYFYLLADKTIDEVIYKAVQKKEDLSSAILEFLRTSNAQKNQKFPKLVSAG